MLGKIYNRLVSPRLQFAAASRAASHDGLTASVVPGGNMAPTIETGEVIWYRPIAECGPLVRGQVVVLRHAEFGDYPVPSRVVGLPGEMLQLREGDLLIDDIRVPEAYVRLERAEEPYSRDTQVTVVPENHNWVMGDFRDMSKDSRHLGPIALSAVQGVVASAHRLGEHGSPRRVR